MKTITLHYDDEKFEKLKEAKANEKEKKSWEDFVFNLILKGRKSQKGG